MNYPEKIGKAIIRLRNARGISQEKMALEAKIDRRYMSDIENGKRNISLDIMHNMKGIPAEFDYPLFQRLFLLAGIGNFVVLLQSSPL